MEFPSFESSLKELEKIESILDKNYPANASILNRDIGIYKIFKNLLTSLNLLKDINLKNCATQPFATLSRMIIDNYSVLYLIAKNSSIKEQRLRYYLYLIDSLEGRIKSITDFSKDVQNNSLIQDFQQSQDIVEHDERAVRNLLNRINSEKLNELVSSKIIDKRNWKFTCENKKERHNWEDLYKIARIPQKFSKIIQNHYSTYTHGLGMTILYEKRNESLIESTMLLLTTINLNIARIILDEYNIIPEKINLDSEFITIVNHQWENVEKWR